VYFARAISDLHYEASEWDGNVFDLCDMLIHPPSRADHLRLGDIKMKQSLFAVLALFAGLPFTHETKAADVLDVKVIGSDLARDIADGSVKECTEQGYAVSAVVVDRSGDIMAAIRGDLASRFTLDIAAGKARAVILSGVNSTEFRESRADIRPDLNHLDGVLVMGGGLIIESGGSRIGAVGVSGAPGADLDAACAEAALDAVFERLGF
jgi:uncharacterized protein GlcG (DUF336 family)